ncbi:MAG TPA: IPT/TIG domain-containing protein, partial [Gammaproteobacteria bacterium]|nr:IPT/TIG domain-containing protein [Gammaproteobacteria bacterium]
MATWAGITQASNYFYDADGRLIVVTTSTGAAALYTYDAVGNIAGIQNVPASQLALLAFQPQSGPVGSQVTLIGAGFSATTSNDTVKFNGVTASVVSATLNQIIATVPNGATTGPISIKVGSATATSAVNFVVTGPIITAFTPVVGSSGTVVTVTGAGFDPVPGSTTATLGGIGISLTTLSNTQFTFSVPATAFSGPIQVVTPDGQGTSTSDFIVPPAAIGVANVGSSTTLTASGPSESLTISNSSQYGIFSFNAVAGQWLSVQLSSLSVVGNMDYTVYSPTNTILTEGFLQSSQNMTIHAPKIAISGTYLVALNAESSSFVSAALEVDKTLAVNGSMQSFATTVDGQSERMLFAGTSGQSLQLAIEGPNIASDSSATVQVTVLNPNGNQISASNCNNSGCVVNLTTLSVSGTYSVYVQSNLPATLSFTAGVFTSPYGQLPTTGVTQNFSTSTAGEAVTLAFSGTQGASLGLGITNLASTPDYTPLQNATVSVYTPSGSLLDSTACYSSNPGCALSLPNLPATGTYTVLITPNSSATLSFSATLSQDVTGTLAQGSALPVTLTVPGQNALLSFSGTPGQPVELQLSGITTTPPNNLVSVTVFNPDGSVYFTRAVSNLETGTVIVPITSTANYEMLVAPYFAVAAELQITFVPEVGGTLSTSSAGQYFYTTTPGQPVVLSFNAAAGENLGLGIIGVTLNPATANTYQVSVYYPSGGLLASIVCSTVNHGCEMPITTLAPGIYAIVIQPQAAATINFTAQLTNDLVITANNATPYNLNIPAPGQKARVVFNVTPGESVNILITGIVTNPSNTDVLLEILGPNGSEQQQASVPNTAAFSLTSLAAGTYTLFINPNYAATASMQVTVLESGLVSTGTLPMDGSPLSFSTTIPGQYIAFNFNATQGQSASLLIDNVTVSVGLSFVNFYVYAPDGMPLGSGIFSSCAVNEYCLFPLVNLPATGTYTVVVTPANANATFGFTARIWPAVTGTLTAGAPFSLTISEPGQMAALNFSGVAGQSYSVQTNNVTTNPSGTPIYLEVDDPTGKTVDIANDFTDSGSTLVVPVSVTGTYTVQIFGFNGVQPFSTAAMQVELSQNVIESLPTNGTPVSLSSTTVGQIGVLTFSAVAGQSFGFAINGLTLSPSSVNNVTYYVTAPNGQPLGGPTGGICYVTYPGCGFMLNNLPQTGIYSIVVIPGGQATMSFTATLSPPVTGTLAIGTPLNINLAAPGQYAELTFTASAGDNLILELNNVVTAPTNAQCGATVFSPDGTTLSSTGAQNGSSSVGLMQMPQTGTYNVQITCGNDGTAQMQVAIVQGTTAPLPTNQTPLVVSIASQVINGALTFGGTAGEDLQIQISDFTLPFGSGSDPGATVTVYKPDGSQQSSITLPAGYVYINVSFSFWLRNLSQTGTYTVVFVPTLACLVQFRATLVPDLTLALPTTGAPVNAATSVPGQNVTFQFSGTTSQNLGLGITGLTFSPNSVTSALVYVYKPDGSQLSSATCNSSTGCAISLRNLPQTGTYEVILIPNGVATMNVTASLSVDVAAALVANTPLNLNLAYPGQEALPTFVVTSGQTVTLTVSGIATTPANNTVNIYIYKPNGSLLTSASTTTSHTFSLGALAAGTYTVFIDPSYPVTATMQVTLQVTAQTLALPLNTSTNFNTVSPGEVLTLTFSGTAGQNLGLGLTAWAISPTSVTTASVSVKQPSGAVVTSATCSTANPGCELNLRNLPATGTYKIVVTPGGSATMSFTAML